MRTPVHIRAKKEDIAENVIAVGDPGRVELLASLLSDAKVVNEHRGLRTVTGYYGKTRVTLATHGIGAASAAIVFEELIMLGAKRIVRLGTTGGIRRDTRLRDIIVATGAAYPQGGCGLGQYMPGICAPTSPHPVLTARIIDSLTRRGVKLKYGPVFSSDAFYAEDATFAEKMEKLGIIGVEMEAATLFALGWMRGVETACVLVVSDVLHGEGPTEFLTTSELAEIFVKAAESILEVFSTYYGGE